MIFNQQTFDELTETNKRLNRRCQLAEHDLSVTKHQMDAAIRVFQFESHRANRYAGELAKIYHHHRKMNQCFGCWWCRIKWRMKRCIWKIFEIKKRRGEP